MSRVLGCSHRWACVHEAGGEVTLSQDPATRINAVQRCGDPVTEDQRAEATALLTDLLVASRSYGATLADFDGVLDLPGGCVDVIVARDDRKRRES